MDCSPQANSKRELGSIGVFEASRASNSTTPFAQEWTLGRTNTNLTAFDLAWNLTTRGATSSTTLADERLLG